MARYRIFYAKRGGACFVPHIVMPSVFSRSAARAGIVFRLTEGFSPHAKMSFGPELPVGVVALRESVDVWLEFLDDALFAAWQNTMPEGFVLKSYEALDDSAVSIGKSFPVSRCLIGTRGDMVALGGFLQKLCASDERILNIKEDGGFWEVLFCNTMPLGAIVRAIISDGVAQGWHDLRIVRKNLEGMTNEKR